MWSLRRLKVDVHAIGVLYVAPGQTEELDIFANSRGSKAYTQMLHDLGEVVRLKGYEGYTGGLDRENELGALVSVGGRDKVAGLVETATAEGATVRIGGTASEHGAFYAPTLLTGVAHGSTINTTEIFGPVTAVVRFTDVDEVVAQANDSEYGLIAYVFGEERAAMQVATRLDVGMVAVNRGVVSDPAAPFGGTKQSGLGREGSSDGILEFLETQYLAVTA